MRMYIEIEIIIVKVILSEKGNDEKMNEKKGGY
jgi:hypothetical protein